jgi:hypothetical protein
MRKQRSASAGKEATPPSNTESSVPVETDGKTPPAIQTAPKYQALAAIQCMRSAAWQYIDNKEVTDRIKEGAFDLYQGLEPKNGLEAALSMLLVGVTNGSLDCLSMAARVPPDETECRDLNLRHGLKGAQVAAKLAEVLETVRGNAANNNVKVGNVNIESGGQAGGQAIVGNVTGGSRGKEADPTPEPKQKSS